MNFTWKDDEQDMLQCQEVFKEIGTAECIFLSHYELAAITKISADVWKKFITHPKVADWISEEFNILQSIKLRKLVDNADSTQRSVGAAQMINALAKNVDSTQSNDGQIFIYSYVPLNKNEQQSEHAKTVDPDLAQYLR